ncbi:transposable element Tcb2 transposase [Trichonephila clavipes]|nr:transposable element Tcb2 transposase [Trichonephila clavipes]
MRRCFSQVVRLNQNPPVLSSQASLVLILSTFTRDERLSQTYPARGLNLGHVVGKRDALTTHPLDFYREDEVEKLAYQLNEEAELKERPIRRLSKVMYGSTCTDMQTTSGCFYPRSNHWEKLEKGRSVTSVAAEFGIAHSIVSRLWRQFQTTGTAIRGFSSGRPRGTTPADDRYIVLQARRNRQQTAGEIARHTTQATG